MPGEEAAMRATAALVLALCTCAFNVPTRQELRLDCIADANLSSYSSETELNYGASSRLRLKGIQMLAVFRFDLAPIKGMLVESARIHLRYAGTDRRLRTLGCSTINVPWAEGTGTGTRVPGAMCFAQAELGRRLWTTRDSDFTDAAFTVGTSLTGYADIRDDGGGWLSAPVDPLIVQAMAAGLAHGLAVTDEKGQTMANNDVFSREQSGSEPYLTVTCRPAPTSIVPSVRRVTATPYADPIHGSAGAVRIAADLPDGLLGCRAAVSVEGESREREVPLHVVGVSRPGPLEAVIADLPPARNVKISLRGVGLTGKLGQPVAVAARTSAALPSTAALSLPKAFDALGPCPARQSSTATITCHPWPETEAPIWSGRAIDLTACRNERTAVLIRVATNGRALRTVRVQYKAAEPDDRDGVRAGFSYLHYVRGAAPMPDTCIPVATAIHDIAADPPPNGLPAQYLVEFDVYPYAADGSHAGELLVSCDDGTPVRFPVSLRVLDAVLPPKLTFELSLNTYGSPARTAHLDPASAEGLAEERRYHRLAHEHGGTLTPLGYSHSGNVEPGYAPELSGNGRTRSVRTWTEWDNRFGPYLSGEAFRGLPRDAQPISHLYLPFHEAWPEDIRTEYAYTPTVHEYPALITEHAMRAGAIENMLSDAYAEGFVRVVREFAQHIIARGWSRTSFHFYLNNKHYYKDPAQGGRGTSWWLLDEPMHRDDWLALAWFGRALKRGTTGIRNHGIACREDVSRPQWQRNYLDGLVDLMVVNDELFARPSLTHTLRRRLGVTIWHYGEAPPPGTPLSAHVAWPIRAYLAGADGIVPWQTIGADAALSQPGPTDLIVPGRTRGIAGPLPTLRFKALARGRQDVELIAALSRARGWNRTQAKAALQPYLSGSRWTEMRAAIHDALDAQGRRTIHSAHRRGQAATAPARRARPNP
jgi:hypothetical protein